MDVKNNYPFAQSLCRNSNFESETQRCNILKTNYIDKHRLQKSFAKFNA